MTPKEYRETICPTCQHYVDADSDCRKYEKMGAVYHDSKDYPLGFDGMFLTKLFPKMKDYSKCVKFSKKMVK